MKTEEKTELQSSRKKGGKRQTWIALLLIVVVIPATLYLSWRYADRQFYITSLLIILYTMIPFFLAFEKQKPQARELVVLAVMCAIAVMSRALFIWVPHFKPMTAMIIIAGIAFGAEAGFLVGALSGFVSNFIFGQGPWTPWQMFAYGVAGFLAGLLYRHGFLSKKRLPLCIFGGAVVILVVGPILDSSSLFTMLSVINPESVAAIYLSGLPVNAMHGLATAVTLLLASGPMFEKLDRIKTKYGMMEE